MADIAMCQHATCPKRHTCYRQTAKADPCYQCYGIFEPDAKGRCEHYWPDRSWSAIDAARESDP